jgi:hypothetical protein
VAEGRIDFRALVRDLAGEFQTRIEMRQVGARDEARLLADYETCGRECCCKNFLKSLKPINMKMAKMQKATLDPAKVSGRCGRLKCCLRYEHATYEELDRKLPPLGTRVASTGGLAGTVIARQILTQLVQIQTDDGGRSVIPVEDLIDEAELAKRRSESASGRGPDRQKDPKAAAEPRRKPLGQTERAANGGPSIDETGKAADQAAKEELPGSEDSQMEQPASGEEQSAESTDPTRSAEGSRRSRGRRRSSRRRGRRRSKGSGGANSSRS